MKKENKEKIENKKSNSVLYILESLLYIIFVIPLIIVTISIVFQSIFAPEKIPNVAGYKMFMVLTHYIDEPIMYGDLVFTKNTELENLNVGDIIAYRTDTTSITKLTLITRIDENNKFFIQDTIHNDVKSVTYEQIEGVVVKRIHKVGLIFDYIQKPLGLLSIECVILSVGLVYYYFVQEQEIRNGNLERRNGRVVKAENRIQNQ